MRRTVMAGVCIVESACAMAQSTTDYLDMTRVQVRGDKTKEFEDASRSWRKSIENSRAIIGWR